MNTPHLVNDPYADGQPISMSRLVVVFVLTVPGFFLAAFIALAVVETEVWLQGQGHIVAAHSEPLFASEPGRIAELVSIDDLGPEAASASATATATATATAGGGVIHPAGAVIARIDAPALRERIAALTTAARDSEARLAATQAQIIAAESEPLPEALATVDIALRRNQAEQAYLDTQLSASQEAYAKGVLSARELRALEWELQQHRLDAELIAARQQRAAEAQQYRQQRLAALRAEYQAEQIHAAGVQAQLDDLEAREQALAVRLPFAAQIVWDRGWDVGQAVQAGALLATAHAIGDRELKITVPDDVFLHTKIGSRVRFTTTVVSVYEYDYYWGEVIERQVISQPDGTHSYQLTATVSPGEEALSIDQLPLGSAGVVEIAAERKSLLHQLVGW